MSYVFVLKVVAGAALGGVLAWAVWECLTLRTRTQRRDMARTDFDASMDDYGYVQNLRNRGEL